MSYLLIKTVNNQKLIENSFAYENYFNLKLNLLKINLISKNNDLIMYFDLNLNYDSTNKSLENYSDFCELVSSAIAGKIN